LPLGPVAGFVNIFPPPRARKIEFAITYFLGLLYKIIVMFGERNKVCPGEEWRGKAVRVDPVEIGVSTAVAQIN
jgi:hypothetical protein